MLTLLASILLLILGVPTVVATVEIFAGLRPRAVALPDGPAPETVVLVPAHDEEAGIVDMLRRVMPALPPNARLLVVADNCTDRTAALARAGGADVVERHDPARRGKGFALAHGRSALAASPPAVVIVLDADCVPEPGALARLARGAAAANRPVQAAYLFEPRPDASPAIRISGFAFLVKNLIRQSGLMRLGAPAILTGSGMAFTWRDFATAPLATDDIVEDLAIGVALARGGSSPRFDPAARVWTRPAGKNATIAQRTRWEHGFLTSARRLSLPLMGEGLRRGRPALAWLGLHIAVPPLAALIGLDGVVLAALALIGALGGPAWPFAAGLSFAGLLVLGVVLAWHRHGQDQVSLGALMRVPAYMLWKVPIYLKLVGGAEKRWVRTDRTDSD